MEPLEILALAKSFAHCELAKRGSKEDAAAMFFKRLMEAFRDDIHLAISMTNDNGAHLFLEEVGDFLECMFYEEHGGEAEVWPPPKVHISKLVRTDDA